MPFKLKRRQFPVRLAIAMTIKKAQGQTLQRMGVVSSLPCIFAWPALCRQFCDRMWIQQRKPLSLPRGQCTGKGEQCSPGTFCSRRCSGEYGFCFAVILCSPESGLHPAVIFGLIVMLPSFGITLSQRCSDCMMPVDSQNAKNRSVCCCFAHAHLSTRECK
jgi:hypothetical protein